LNRKISNPPAGYYPRQSDSPPPWQVGTILEVRNNSLGDTAILGCENPDGEADPIWYYSFNN